MLSSDDAFVRASPDLADSAEAAIAAYAAVEAASAEAFAAVDSASAAAFDAFSPVEEAFSPVSLTLLDLDALAEALAPRISVILARQVNLRRYGA